MINFNIYSISNNENKVDLINKLEAPLCASDQKIGGLKQHLSLSEGSVKLRPLKRKVKDLEGQVNEQPVKRQACKAAKKSKQVKKAKEFWTRNDIGLLTRSCQKFIKTNNNSTDLLTKNKQLVILSWLIKIAAGEQFKKFTRCLDILLERSLAERVKKGYIPDVLLDRDLPQIIGFFKQYDKRMDPSEIVKTFHAVFKQRAYPTIDTFTQIHQLEMVHRSNYPSK